jgi:hypothetical protein
MKFTEAHGIILCVDLRLYEKLYDRYSFDHSGNHYNDVEAAKMIFSLLNNFMSEEGKVAFVETFKEVTSL